MVGELVHSSEIFFSFWNLLKCGYGERNIQFINILDLGKEISKLNF